MLNSFIRMLANVTGVEDGFLEKGQSPVWLKQRGRQEYDVVAGDEVWVPSSGKDNVPSALALVFKFIQENMQAT
eukprot:CAMPEP_0201283802 /NCGR_PEP_ID=MMETSP1317-20130820/48665_1 /ASSEMBLY_ACC=CAM_ASM_000770 /TAXON_ID=187299 /ORGANISM="Undescribed Undescribed, Strain Undescribed" /LENGTH=73 /DNA_ID=CAMNT_0047601423 /DNA_START=335 /DNA_END=552 /DNA_ORIENTATION=+